MISVRFVIGYYILIRTINVGAIDVNFSNNIDSNYHVTGFLRSESLWKWISSKLSSLFSQENQNANPMPINCDRNLKQLVCTLDTDLEGIIIQIWYQDYGDQQSVIDVPLQARKTKLIMTLERFDNNTEIYNTVTATNLNKAFTTGRRKIHLDANEFGKYSNVTTLKYGLTKEVLFSCSNYLNETKYIQIGLINISNKITTYNEIWINRKFNKADNGTIMCCLLYVIDDSTTRKQMERFVENKTIIIYDESPDFMPFERTETSSIYKNSVVYIIISIVVIIVLVAIIYTIKCYRKNPDPEESLELNTYASTNRVLYADLNFVSDSQLIQRTKDQEESTYAEIIGVLKPSQGQ